jgi:group I intron endonuclease
MLFLCYEVIKKMQNGTIYLIENTINGHKYVGQTRVKLKKRLHLHYLESKRFTQRPLYRAINKYGIGKFKVSILEKCDNEELDDKERHWISKLNTFKDPQHYNCTDGGEGNVISEDTKERISKGMKDVPRDEKWCKSMSESHKKKLDRGEKWGFLNPILNGNGKHRCRRIKATPESNPSGCQNVVITDNKEIIFESTKEAAKYVNGATSNISRATKENWVAYGYRWELLDKRPVKFKVYGIHKDTGERTEMFPSINAASKNWGMNDNNFRRCLKDKTRTAAKHHWYFHDEKPE